MNTLKLSDTEVATLAAALDIARDYWREQCDKAQAKDAEPAMKASLQLFEEQVERQRALRAKVEEETGQ